MNLNRFDYLFFPDAAVFVGVYGILSLPLPNKCVGQLLLAVTADTSWIPEIGSTSWKRSWARRLFLQLHHFYTQATVAFLIYLLYSHVKY